MGIWVRVVAHLRREVSVEKLEAYREAGSSVYDLLDRVQQHRDEVKVGRSPWDAAIQPTCPTSICRHICYRCGWT